MRRIHLRRNFFRKNLLMIKNNYVDYNMVTDDAINGKVHGIFRGFLFIWNKKLCRII